MPSNKSDGEDFNSLDLVDETGTIRDEPDRRQEWLVAYADGGSTRITGRESWVRGHLFGPDRWIPTGEGTETDPIRFINKDHVVVVQQYFEERYF